MLPEMPVTRSISGVEVAESCMVILKGALEGKFVVEATVRVVSEAPMLEARVVRAKLEKFSAHTELMLSMKMARTSSARAALSFVIFILCLRLIDVVSCGCVNRREK